MPHPNLHEFFLNPFLPVREEVRILYSVLMKVSTVLSIINTVSIFGASDLTIISDN